MAQHKAVVNIDLESNQQPRLLSTRTGNAHQEPHLGESCNRG